MIVIMNNLKIWTVVALEEMLALVNAILAGLSDTFYFVGVGLKPPYLTLDWY